MKAPGVAIIDDDKIYHTALKLILTTLSPASKILNFENGKEGYEFLIHYSSNEYILPDCIFLDLEMPVMNGIAFLERYDNIREYLKKDIAIFVISNSLTDKNKKIIEKYPFVKGSLCKPFKSKDVKNLLTAFI